MQMNLNGKVVIVTGGGGGLGRAISEELAAEGANVVVNYRSKEKETIELVNKMNETFHTKNIAVKADMSKKEDLDNLFNTAYKTYGKVDILVNNAGIWLSSTVKEMPIEDFEKTLKVNLEAPFILCQKMINHLIDRDCKGKIINVVSQAAFHGSTTGHAHYAASKAGLVTFTVSLAREVAKFGINCNCVAPGMMKTDMVSKAISTKKGEEYYNSRIPLRRIAEPEEVAKAVVFLASENADYITGATIDATGGMLMR